MFWMMLTAAWASYPYPAALQEELTAPCAPTCTVCHASNAGGGGTVVTEFGVAMMERGLVGASDTASLTAALDQMITDGVDADGDGLTDAEALSEGLDPNPGGAAFCDVLTPSYGCFNTSARPASWLGVLAGLFVWRRRVR